ncbi:MAG: phosphatidate cytidylyltransferase [Alysiella sp.]|uniref:phosphatidate cytidylyltransferase n=1 Tax=Alysiella sp. TaxID=1872483 RepID=UPI0026DD6FAE|nr:phosphatidate cytidylyltransferase [Alysiella sp.]MDO4434295.1 phosphatidate cytidylyltransferase [Alysiella sp.]
MNTSFPIQAGYVFLGVFVVLIIASIIGKILRTRAPLHRQETIANLNARIDSWWVMIVILLLSFLFGHIGTTILFLGVSFAALREFMSLVYRHRSDHNTIAACFYILLPMQYYFVLTGWYGMFSIFIPVYAFLLLPIIAAMAGNTTNFFERTAKIQWGAMMTLFCISHIPALMTLKIDGFEGQNILLVIFMVVVVQASDVCQYIWGKLMGKRKIMPALSPNKTVEGTVGGIATATLIAAACYWLTPFTPFQAALIGFVVCLMGFFGGLVMSAIKRSFGVKDWGRMIRGHGGMLDRVDSLCFAAPVFFHIVRYFWA